MHLSYDPDFEIAYIRLRPKRGKVKTVTVSDELNVDLDAQGRVYGIELLNANKREQGGVRSIAMLLVVSLVIAGGCALTPAEREQVAEEQKNQAIREREMRADPEDREELREEMNRKPL